MVCRIGRHDNQMLAGNSRSEYQILIKVNCSSKGFVSVDKVYELPVHLPFYC